jgi:serine protease
VACLLLASGVSPADVKEALKQSAEDLGPEGWDEYYGHGLVDAGYAIAGQRAPAHPLVFPVGKLSVTWGKIKAK